MDSYNQIFIDSIWSKNHLAPFTHSEVGGPAVKSVCYLRWSGKTTEENQEEEVDKSC